MITSVQLNRNYAIYLSDLYGSEKYNVQVVGTTTIDSLAKNAQIIMFTKLILNLMD